MLSDVSVHSGDVLNIRCNIGSALRVTNCQLIRNHHHHLETCLESENRTKTAVSDGVQNVIAVNQASNQQSDSSQHRDHICDISHPHQDLHRLQSSSEPQTSLCVKTMTGQEFASADGMVDPQTDDYYDTGHSLTYSNEGDRSVTCFDSETTADLLQKPPATTSSLDSATDEQTDEIRDQLRHDHCNCDVSSSDAETGPTSVSHCNVKRDWFHLDRTVIGQLNDVFWLESCLKALHQLIDLDHHRHRQLLILSQTPSMFPIAALRLDLVSHVCFLDLDPVHRPLIGRLLSANSVGEGHVTYGRPWQRDVTTVLFADIVSSEGCLQQNVFESLIEARSVTFIIFSLLLGIEKHFCNY